MRVPLTLSRKGLLLVALPLFVQFALVLAVKALESQYDADAHWQIHTQDVVAQANRVLRLVVEAESSIRGYALTGDRALARPYERAAREVPAAVAGLASLVS